MVNLSKIVKIFVIGLGSMGKRRIRIVQAEYPDIQIFGIDQRKDRQIESENEFNIKTMDDIKKAFKCCTPDIVFVCTSPLSHLDFVLYSLQNNAHTFSEINLSSDGYTEILSAAQSFGKIAFISSTPLYKKEIRWLIDKIGGKNRFSYRYHVGQYLPDWHPWEKYKDFFVADKKTNALREIMAIEFPWIVKAFGMVDKFNAIKSNHSMLQIDYPDTIQLIFRHKNGNTGSICIDCLSRKAVRSLEIYSEKNYWLWNGTPDSLQQYSIKTKQLEPVYLYENIVNDSRYADNILENPYIEEIYDFMATIDDRFHKPLYDYQSDQYILGLIDKIENNG